MTTSIHLLPNRDRDAARRIEAEAKVIRPEPAPKPRPARRRAATKSQRND